jgi:CheY-like chemotaxis protein
MASTKILILVVENEAIILDTLHHALEEAGFAVTSASSGEQALQLLEANEHGFRALVTDIDLGGAVSGWQVAHRARELSPSLPVIYMTGGNAAEWSANGVPESLLLNKPFAFAQVVTALAQLLNAASSALPPPPAPPAS